MVPLKFLRKRCMEKRCHLIDSITIGPANRAVGLCKYCKGLPHPPAQLA